MNILKRYQDLYIKDITNKHRKLFIQSNKSILFSSFFATIITLIVAIIFFLVVDPNVAQLKILIFVFSFAILSLIFLSINRSKIKDYQIYILVEIVTFLSLSTGIVLGTVLAPTKLAVTTHILLIFTMFIFNIFPLQRIINVTIMGGMFLFLSHTYKDISLFEYDAVHLILSLSIGEVISFTKTRQSLKNIVYDENLKILNDQLYYNSVTDLLTNLYNKVSFEFMVEGEIKEIDKENCWLLIFDLDDLKVINDSYGHSTGDAVLKHVGTTLKVFFQDYGIAGRIGGDEFAVYIRKDCGKNKIKHLYRQYINMLNDTIPTSKVSMISISCGATMIQDNESKYHDCYVQADYALYRAKNLGKRTISFYDDLSSIVLIGEKTIETREILKNYLSNYHSVKYVFNEKDLLKKIDSNNYDIAIIDENILECSLQEFIEKLNELGLDKQKKFIYITNEQKDIDSLEYRVLLKPINIDLLKFHIDGILKSK